MRANSLTNLGVALDYNVASNYDKVLVLSGIASEIEELAPHANEIATLIANLPDVLTVQEASELVNNLTVKVTTLPEGATATSELIGTEIRLGIPAGAQGVQGTQGPKGDKGDRGDIGLTGAKGPTGATGPQGPRGFRGEDGLDGEGVVITSILNNLNKSLTINFSDGTQHTTDPLKGEDGRSVTITNVVNNANGTMLINFSDGTSHHTADLTGPRGFKGDTGDHVHHISYQRSKDPLGNEIGPVTPGRAGNYDTYAMWLSQEELPEMYIGEFTVYNGLNTLPAEDQAKLDSVEFGATADQEAFEVPYDNTTSGLLSEDVQNSIDELSATKLNILEKGQPNGVAELDANGLVPSAQLPSYVDDVIEVETYADLPVEGETGKIYVVVTDETSNDDTSTYRWTGTVYAVVSNTLNAVDVKALYEANPDTNAYTDAEKNRIDINTDLTTTAQTLPTAVNEIDSRVANIEDNTTLAEYGITDAYTKTEVQETLPAVGLDTTNIIAPTRPGQIKWNQKEGTADLALNNGVTLQLGQENTRLVRNDTLDVIPNMTVCMFDGTLGNSGRIKVAPFTGLFDQAQYIYGIATQSINVGEDGYITIDGKVRNVDTTGAAVGETWLDGDILYVKPSNVGHLTKVVPADNELKMPIASVIHAHVNGTLEVRVLPFNENMIAKRADKWTTARTITLDGDVSGSASVDGSANVTITATVQPNSVELGTDTTGNYMANAVAGSGISVSHTQGEGSTATITNSAPNVTTDITTTHTLTDVVVNSSDGTDGTINSATQALAGVMSAADKTKLDGIQAGAQVNTVNSVNGRTGAVTGLVDGQAVGVGVVRNYNPDITLEDQHINGLGSASHGNRVPLDGPDPYIGKVLYVGDAEWGTQLWFSYNEGKAWFRNKNTGKPYEAWKEFIHTGNIRTSLGYSIYPVSQKLVTDQLASKANSSHTHPHTQVTGLGTAASSNVVQATGQSATGLMSQKAVTDALNTKVGLTDNQTIPGIKTFSSSPIVPTPTENNQAVNKEYVDLMATGGSLGAYGVRFDQENDIITPLGSSNRTLIQEKMKRCVLNADGTVKYFLDQYDSTKKEGSTGAGTPSVLDGTDGNVMVQVPLFYIKHTLVNDVHEWWVSLFPEEGYSIHPWFLEGGVTHAFRYYRAYTCSVKDGKLMSISGVKPTASQTRATFRTQARANGAGWNMCSWNAVNSIQLLFLTEYCTFNSQAVLGTGNHLGSDYAMTTGASNSLGNQSSVYGLDKVMSYRGIENFYADTWEFVDGINVQNYKVFLSQNPATFADDVFTGDYKDSGVTVPAASASYVKKISGNFIPTAVGGSSSTYITDGFWSAAGDRIALFGGSADFGALDGAFCLLVLNAASDVSVAVGAGLSR